MNNQSDLNAAKSAPLFILQKKDVFEEDVKMTILMGITSINVLI